MKPSDIILKCELIQQRLISAAPRTVRPYCESLHIGSRGIVFSGARGVGKTTFMLQKLKNEHMLYQLLEAMERAHVIRIIRHKKDHSVHSAGAKIFYHEPSLYKTFMEHEGNFREAFTVCAFQESGKTIWAAKNEQQGDFVIDDFTVEIGGKKKKGKGADYMIKQDVDFPVNNIIPLWMLGFIW